MAEHARAGRNLERAISVVGVGLVLLAVAWGVSSLRPPNDVFAPLGPYAEQKVTSDRSFEGMPAFVPNEQINVEGTKCSSAAIQVFGIVNWIRVEPPGQTLTTSQGSRFAEVGCVTSQYANDIPPSVAEVVQDEAARGINTTVWRISGIETPIDSETGRNGETATWLTEPFVLKAG